jgi:hypothetical protein
LGGSKESIELPLMAIKTNSLHCTSFVCTLSFSLQIATIVFIMPYAPKNENDNEGEEEEHPPFTHIFFIANKAQGG